MKSVSVQIRMDERAITQLDVLAEATGTNRSEVIRAVIMAAMVTRTPINATQELAHIELPVTAVGVVSVQKESEAA
jgi:metal-responsive CopG/Arc/MetJ family transcriptional regulator